MTGGVRPHNFEPLRIGLDEAGLAELRRVFGDDVVDVKCNVYSGRKEFTVTRRLGSTVILGSGGQVRDPEHLNRKLMEIGRPPISKAEAGELFSLLLRWVRNVQGD